MRLSGYDKKHNYLGVFRFAGKTVRMYGTRSAPWFAMEDVRHAVDLPPEADAPWGHKRVINVDDGSQLWLMDELGLYTMLLKADTTLTRALAENLVDGIMPNMRRYGSSRGSRDSRSR